MTLAELSRYHDIKVELADLKSRIEEIEETLIQSTKYSDTKSTNIFNNSSPTEKTAFQLCKLKEQYDLKIYDLINEQIRIEKYLDSVTDSEIKTIMRYRFIDCLTWDVIAVKLNYSRANPYIKIKNYLRGEKDERENWKKL